MILRRTLDNGIKVIGESMDHVRSAAIGVWVGAGSVYEQAGEEGASHFIEHMLFKGTEHRSAKDIAAEMDSIGGNINAFTSKECTCFYAKVLDEHIEQAADILSDIVRYSKFDEEEIQKEKGVVCEEILMVEDSPEDLAHETLAHAYFSGDPLAKPILGTKESVMSFSRDTLLQYMGKHYTPENIVISCAGHFDDEKMMQTLNHYFSGVAHGVKSNTMQNKPAGGTRLQLVEKDVEQVHICMALPGVALDERLQYPLYVLNNALGGGMSSRLFQKIREQKGLAYSTYSYPSAYRTTGYFALYAGTGEAQAADVISLMLEELHQIKAHGLTKEEFNRSKNQLKGSYLLAQEGTSSRMNALGKAELLLNRLYSEEETIQRIERVTMENIEEIIHHAIDFNNLTAVCVGRVNKQKEKLEQVFAANQVKL